MMLKEPFVKRYEPTVWQVGQDRTRNLAPDFARYGTAFIGPDTGDLRRMSEDELGTWARENESCTGLHEFCHQVKPGDLIVSRENRATIAYIGMVEAGYHYRPTWNGYRGWEQPHMLERVRWWRVVDMRAIRAGGFPRRRFSQYRGIDGFLESLDFDGWRSLRQVLRHHPALAQVKSRNLPRTRRLEAPFWLKNGASEEEKVLEQLTRGRDEERRKVLLLLPFLFRLGWRPSLLNFEDSRNDIVAYHDEAHTKPRILFELKEGRQDLAQGLAQAQAYVRSRPKTWRRTLRYCVATNGVHFLVWDRKTKKTQWFDRYYRKTTSMAAARALRAPRR